MPNVNKSAADVVVASTGEALKTNANVRQSVIVGIALLAGVAGTILVNKIRAKKDADATVEA